MEKGRRKDDGENLERGRPRVRSAREYKKSGKGRRLENVRREKKGTEATEKISREARKSKDKEIEKSEWEAAEKQNEKLRRK